MPLPGVKDIFQDVHMSGRGTATNTGHFTNTDNEAGFYCIFFLLA